MGTLVVYRWRGRVFNLRLDHGLIKLKFATVACARRLLRGRDLLSLDQGRNPRGVGLCDVVIDDAEQLVKQSIALRLGRDRVHHSGRLVGHQPRAGIVVFGRLRRVVGHATPMPSFFRSSRYSADNANDSSC